MFCPRYSAILKNNGVLCLKKRYIGLAALAMLSCTVTGCGKSDAQVKPEIPNLCTAQVTDGEKSYSADLCRDESGVWTVRFSQPETICDMTVKTFGESYAIEFSGLSQQIERGKMPIGSVAASVTECLDHAANSSSVKCEKDGEEIMVRGEAPCGEYILRTDSSGKLISLSIDNRLSVEFSDIQMPKSE